MLFRGLEVSCLYTLSGLSSTFKERNAFLGIKLDGFYKLIPLIILRLLHARYCNSTRHLIPPLSAPVKDLPPTAIIIKYIARAYCPRIECISACTVVTWCYR